MNKYMTTEQFDELLAQGADVTVSHRGPWFLATVWQTPLHGFTYIFNTLLQEWEYHDRAFRSIAPEAV